jgi:drug/metabolite transporter (DMT)-like permease
VLVIGAGIFMLTIGARSVPAAELLVLSMTEVVFASVWVALAFGEVPSVLTLAGGAILLGSIAGQAAFGMRR